MTTRLCLATLALVCAPPASAQCLLSERMELQDPSGAADTLFGSSLEVSGDVMAVGASNDSTAAGSAGAVQIFERSGSVWAPTALLVAPDAADEDYLGVDLGLDGLTLVAGAPWSDPGGHERAGAAYVFERGGVVPGQWRLVAKLVAPVLDFGALFGGTVDISGDTIAVGAPGQDVRFNEGAVYIFERNHGGPDRWGCVKQLSWSGSSTKDWFGGQLALEGDALVVGAEYDDTSGAAYLFERDHGGPGNWGEAHRFEAWDPVLLDRFGASVAIRGDRVLVGAPNHDHYAPTTGAAYLFERDAGGPGQWGQVLELLPQQNVPWFGASSYLGHEVALGDDLAYAGAGIVSLGQGPVHVFGRTAGPLGQWTRLALLAPTDGQFGDLFGLSLALSDDGIWASAPSHEHGGGDDGAVYFTPHPAAVRPASYCTPGTSASGCAPPLSTIGLSSATAASGFDLAATAVEGGASGLFFFGTSGRQASPWGNGTSYQCVSPPVARGALQSASGTAGACDGQLFYDLNARWNSRPAQNPGAGALVQAQLWYRDPASTSNQATSLSNAVEFLVCLMRVSR